MNYSKAFIAMIIAAISIVSCSSQPTPPVAKKIAKETNICGKQLLDNYYWMRLTDEQKEAKSPDAQTTDVLNYLNQENEYADRIMNQHKDLLQTLYDEMKGRIKENDSSLPYKTNGYWYMVKTEEGKDYPIFCRKEDKKDATEEILLDINELANGKSFCNVSSRKVSPDNKFIAYCADFIGRRRYSIYIKDLVNNTLLSDVIENADYSFEWGSDSKTIYYIKKDSTTLRSDKIYRHYLNKEQEDQLLFTENDETYNLNLSKTSDKKYIIATSNQTLTSEINYIESSDNNGTFKSFSPRIKDIKYTIDHSGDKFFILTNINGADNYKIMTLSDKVAKSQKNLTNKLWIEYIPENKQSIINEFKVFSNYIALSETTNANEVIRIIDVKTLESHYIKTEESAYYTYLDMNPEYNTDILRYGYTSLSTPSQIYDYNMKTKESTLMKEKEVPNYNKTNYIVERVLATARDSSLIPISIIYKKDIVKDGKAGLLLYAYGSYGSSTFATFNSNIFSLLDRGFIYAIAHIRGGSEMGYNWYKDGKLLKKQNTFNDFIDCSKYLIDQKYTSANRLYASGGSAGGLLMGVIANQAPELYNGIIAAVPFVDVINTMSDETIPLTTFEWDEWGDPRSEPGFSSMLAYSPYDNIKKQNYPNMLVTSGYWDSQVQYWEPAKWVAKLREYKTDSNKLLFICNMQSGHGGVSGRFEKLKNIAKEYAFIISICK